MTLGELYLWTSYCFFIQYISIILYSELASKSLTLKSLTGPGPRINAFVAIIQNDSRQDEPG